MEVCAGPHRDTVHHDMSYDIEHIRLALISCAVDSTLAAAIFSRIATAKPKSAVTLQSLELSVINAGVMTSQSPDISRPGGLSKFYEDVEVLA